MTMTNEPLSDLSDIPSLGEDDLLTRAESAISYCNWTIGACASRWVQPRAKGRTDEDFGKRIGLQRDRVCQRRMVWDRFGATRQQFSELTWSHFRAAIGWDDAEQWLDWAQEMGSTVSEMRRFRKIQTGLPDEEPPTAEESDLPEVGECDTGHTPAAAAATKPAAAIRDEDPPFEPLTPEQPVAISRAIQAAPEADAVHIDEGPDALAPNREPHGAIPSKSEINATLKALENVVEVVRAHWGRFTQAQRDRCWTAQSALQELTGNG